MGTHEKKKRKSIEGEDGIEVSGGSKKRERSEKSSEKKLKKLKKSVDLEEDKESSKVVKKLKLDMNLYQSPISSPMADSSLEKKLLKLVTKASKAKSLRRGIKEVCKALRKGASGLCVLAGDVYPMDVIAHIPVLLEESQIAYCYVPSKVLLGAASSTKRPTSIVLVSSKGTDEFKDDYKECEKQVKALPIVYKV
mmetsp:Transcript_9999/g.18007  ORF Transcript_9999/g.18007 Transcript_9999/m.18007 type:complete len:195 (+) Transcript_9999:85-669(+)